MQGGPYQPYPQHYPPPYRPPPPKGDNTIAIVVLSVLGLGVVAVIGLAVLGAVVGPRAGAPATTAASASASAAALSSADAAAAWPGALKFAQETLTAANKLIASGKIVAGDDMLAGEEEALAQYAATPVASQKDYAEVTKKIADRRKAIAAQVKPLRAQQEKQLAAASAKAESEAAKRGPKPKASAWDGAPFAVERYLKPRMNDPDSLDFDGCTVPIESGEFWVVGCSYRGKNGFGALVLNGNFFYIQHDQVVKVEEL